MYNPNPPAPRKPGPKDFTVDVPNVGQFTFGYRNFADQFAMEVEFARLTQGVTPTQWLSTVGEWMATLRVLLVSAPAGFDLDEVDPLEDGVYDLILSVYTALREKEDSFRKKPKKSGAGDGQAAGPDGGVLVPPQVQPVAAGPAVP